ncbi:hypothetical protein ACJX0J_021240, partial [Zea mays]
GFTMFTRAEYLKYKSGGRIASDGVNAKDKKHQLYVISALAGTKIDMKSCYFPTFWVGKRWSTNVSEENLLEVLQ